MNRLKNNAKGLNRGLLAVTALAIWLTATMIQTTNTGQASSTPVARVARAEVSNAAPISTYSDRSAFLAAAGGTTAIDFATKDDGLPITSPGADIYFPVFTRSCVRFHDVQSYYNESIYCFPNAVIQVDLPPCTMAIGTDLIPFYPGTGTYQISLSTGDTYQLPNPSAARFFGVISDTPIQWARFSLDNTYLKLDNFAFSVQPCPTPALSYDSPQPAIAGTTIVSPTSLPSTDGTTTFAVQSITPNTFTGTITVNSAGIVLINNAGPAGSFNVTIRATDCSTITDGSFILNVPSSLCGAPPANLIGWWPGDGNANDKAGNNGTLRNGATFAQGLIGQAFSLSGGYVEVPDSPSVSLDGPLTLDAWINTNTNTTQQAIIEKYDGPGRNGYYLRITGAGKLAASVCNPSSCNPPAIGATTLTTGVWHHVAAVYDATSVKVYVDGILDGSITLGPTDGANSLKIGARGDDANTRFNGLIDEAQVLNRALTETEIQAVVNAGSAGQCKPAASIGCIPSPAGLVSWWPGDGDANDIQDGNNGALRNGATFAQGIVGQAFSLDGVSHYVEVADSPSLSITGPLTLEAWVNTNTNTVQQAIIEKYDVPGRNGYLLRLNAAGQVEATVCNPATAVSPARGATTLSTGVWHHVAAVYDGTTTRVYVDGVLDGSVSLGPTDGTASLKIGARGDDAGTRFNGLIDEVQIFNRALTQTEIQDIIDGDCADTTPPTVSCPGPLNASAGSNCQAQVPDVLGGVTASDDSPGSVTLSQNPAAGTLVGLGTTMITVTAMDAANNASTCTTTFTVTDSTPPAINCSSNVTTLTDPGQCTAVVSFAPDVTDNCSGASFVCSPPSGTTFPIGMTSVSCTATDAAGNSAACGFTVTVNNSSPVASISSPSSGAIYAVGTTVNFAGSFSDNAGDAHTAEWSFVSNTQSLSQPGTVNESTGAVGTSYTFASAGVYLVSLTVADQCGHRSTANVISPDGLTAMVVIYDPSGGFVTGGGWIDSPAGAYTANPSLAGRASFGFVSRYQNGATVPTGNTEFQFRVANFNFHSTVYEWLVVSGARAQFKGTGTVNGAGDYRFILTAIDGQANGGGGLDKFRIRIWDNIGGGIVYDNQMNAPDTSDPTTALGGGSIVIHN